jgi:hypothetical protein
MTYSNDDWTDVHFHMHILTGPSKVEDGCTPCTVSLFPKEITVHSGIVLRDKIYGDRRQICERVEVSTIKYQLFRWQKMKYLFFCITLLIKICAAIFIVPQHGYPRTQSPSYARCDEGLWPNPYQTGIWSQLLLQSPSAIWCPCWKKTSLALAPW